MTPTRVFLIPIFLLAVSVSAQTLRPDNDPRNVVPTVGTGGSPAGSTGLFTIIDAQTIRWKESTFSAAFSRFHRDPGNADISEVPLSSQAGVNDHFELFFSQEGYRAVKVNRPQNLSSFYLPNSQVLIGTTLISRAAIILAPINNAGITGAVFRPAGNQPFVQFPYVGGSAGSFQNGFAGSNQQFTFTLGTPLGGGGIYGRAANFPGIGSVVGSILPGVVLSTTVRPATATTQAITVPQVFTLAPSYLPDAPFVNRADAKSSFGTYTIGAKYRFSGPNSAFGIAVMPFYRFYADKANSSNGFDQLQRGSSPGGSWGDIGAVLALDGRLHRSVNVSVNVGYTINSNPRSSAFGSGNVTLLDRPNEFVAGVGFDFPINKHVQPIVELRSTRYVGMRTENAFPNNPLEIIAGLRLFLSRESGFGFAYRRHLNSQSANRFRNSLPNGFLPSENSNGFMVQFWFGKRNKRENHPPDIDDPTSDPSEEDGLTLACPAGYIPQNNACPRPQPFSGLVKVGGRVTDAENNPVTISWNSPPPTGGRIVGEGENVSWDLNGVGPGEYVATMKATDDKGASTSHEFRVTIKSCSACCPTITVPDLAPVPEGTVVTFTANVSASDAAQLPYKWEVSSGRIVNGQGTSSISVDTMGAGGKTINAKVMIESLNAACENNANGNVTVTQVNACPTIEIVNTPERFVEASAQLQFEAKLQGGNATGTPTFTWSVSSGEIVQGQGTSSILVKAPTDTNTPLTAEVNIGGFGNACQQTSAPVEILKPFDRYGYICFNDEKARLDNFAIALSNDPRSEGFIIAYSGQKNSLKEAQARAERARRYLYESRGIDVQRIKVKAIKGGASKYLRGELWVRPLGAGEPPIGVNNPQLIPGLSDISPADEYKACYRKRNMRRGNKNKKR